MARRSSTFRSRHVSIPKESRTTLVFDETAQFKGDKDNRKYYKCWNCGQICHEGEHQLGGSKSGDAIEHFDFTIASSGIISGDKLSTLSILGDLRTSMASLELNSSGGTKTVLHSHRTTGGGCPLCHTLNWRGDYP